MVIHTSITGRHMIRSRFVRTSVLILTAFVAVSCAENSPTAPSAPVSAIVATDNSQQALLGGIGGLIGGLLKPVVSIVGFVLNPSQDIRAVAWNSSHADVSYGVSGYISPSGGTLTIPEADFSIVFPAGAVRQSTKITITSDPKYVAYAMTPHMTFARPVVVTQRLRNTAVHGLSLPANTQLFGAYVADGLDLTGLLKALEIELSATIFAPGSSTIPETEVWTLNHFSRYMLASG